MKTDDFYDRREILDLITTCMRNALAPGNEARFQFCRALSEQRDRNGDINDYPTDEEEAAAMRIWRALPAEQQRHILNGWNPKVLEMDRTAWIKGIATLCLHPVLRLDASSKFGATKRPYGGFDLLPDGSSPTCTLMIAAGATKGEVLDSLENLTNQVDEWFNDLIADPLNERARGKEVDDATTSNNL